jgi:hypothetical protein
MFPNLFGWNPIALKPEYIGGKIALNDFEAYIFLIGFICTPCD